MTALVKVSMTLGVMLALGGAALAQPAPPPPPPGGGAPMSGGDSGARMKSIGADAAFVVPIGKYGDGVDFGIGVLARVEVPVAPQISITGRLGYVMFTGTPSGVTFAFIPVLAGLRYDLAPTGQGLFLLGEAGFTNVRVSIDGGGSADETDLSVGVGAGFQTGKISARGTLYIPDTGHAGDSLSAMVNVGYDFASF